RGDRLAGYRCRDVLEEAGMHLREGRGRMPALVLDDCALSSIIALEIVRAGFRAHDAPTAVEEVTPLVAGIARVLDVLHESKRGRVVLEVPERLGALLVPDGKGVEVTPKADVDRPGAAGWPVNAGVQRRRRRHDDGSSGWGVQPLGRRQRELRGNVV